MLKGSRTFLRKPSREFYVLLLDNVANEEGRDSLHELHDSLLQ
jgi:hypothetical protein